MSPGFIPRRDRQAFRSFFGVHLFVGLLSFLWVLLGMGLSSHAALELEELAEPFAGLALRQALFAGDVEMQVSVEALVENLRGRKAGAAGPAQDSVQPVNSVRDATKARKITWLEWALDPSEGRDSSTRFTQQEKDEKFAADEVYFLASDRDGDGLVSFLELKRSFKRWSLPLGVVKSSFREADVDGDVSLSFGEYLVAWESLSDWLSEAESSG